MNCKAFALLTDFGLDDPYVGQMKGVLCSFSPKTQVLDISHGVRPHNIIQAGFFLAASWPYLPIGSVCLAVVDPGVGSSRDILLLDKEERFVLAPDNGLLSQVLLRPGTNRLWRLTVQQKAQAVSNTFHGRDLFAPAAAELVRGCRPDELSEPVDIDRIVHLRQAEPEIGPERFRTSVGHVDRFGNCLLMLPATLWDNGLSGLKRLSLLEPLERPVQTADSYAAIEPGAIGLVPSSQGYLELAVNQGSCSYELGLDIGDECLFQGDFSGLASSP